LNAKKYGAAFLAQTLVLRSDEVAPNLRRQPLLNAPDVYLLAVTRTETDKKSVRIYLICKKRQSFHLSIKQ
jgi:hypothetical protein